MDKQEKLNEIRQILLSASYDWWETAPNGKTKSEYGAERLYNAGYRKIPENAVVLTREEYEKIKSLYNSQGAYMTSSIGDLPLTVEGLRKAVDEITRLYSVQNELQELNAKYYNEAKDLRREVNRLQAHAKIKDEHLHVRLTEQVRKETAEKFARKAKEQFADSARLCEQIDEICKEITEE